jgi:hypothetical protein
MFESSLPRHFVAEQHLEMLSIYLDRSKSLGILTLKQPFWYLAMIRPQEAVLSLLTLILIVLITGAFKATEQFKNVWIDAGVLPIALGFAGGALVVLYIQTRR